MNKTIVAVTYNFTSRLLMIWTAIRMCERGSVNLQLENRDVYTAWNLGQANETVSVFQFVTTFLYCRSIFDFG